MPLLAVLQTVLFIVHLDRSSNFFPCLRRVVLMPIWRYLKQLGLSTINDAQKFLNGDTSNPATAAAQATAASTEKHNFLGSKLHTQRIRVRSASRVLPNSASTSNIKRGRTTTFPPPAAFSASSTTSRCCECSEWCYCQCQQRWWHTDWEVCNGTPTP